MACVEICVPGRMPVKARKMTPACALAELDISAEEDVGPLPVLPPHSRAVPWSICAKGLGATWTAEEAEMAPIVLADQRSWRNAHGAEGETADTVPNGSLIGLSAAAGSVAVSHRGDERKSGGDSSSGNCDDDDDVCYWGDPDEISWASDQEVEKKEYPAKRGLLLY
eukprot:2294947-Pleurochrysis_carterae.AAC.9